MLPSRSENVLRKDEAEMKTRWLVMGLVMVALPGLAVPLAWGQPEGSQERSTGKLTRVTPPSPAPKSSADFDRDAWRKKITAGDLEEREAAFDRLSGLARHDPAAREALEAWSRDESDTGLAWTSRLILREVDRGPQGWIQGGSQPGWDLFGHGFDFDGFSQRFDDLDSLFGDLRSQWDGMLQHLPSPSAEGKVGTGSAESMTLQSGPDGVTCKIIEKVDGEEKTREYSAKTMEELLDANPELRQKLGSGGSMVWTFPNGRNRMLIPRVGGLEGGLRILPRGFRGELSLENDAQEKGVDPRTDRLGIYCAPLDASTAAELGLAPGEGLRVQNIQPGTIASILGLRTGDVVIGINGATIRSAEDVKKVLAGRAEGSEVSVVVVGAEGRRTLTWKPAAKKPDAPESKSGSRNL